MSEYERRLTGFAVIPKGKSIRSQDATNITVDDTGTSEFIKVHQPGVGHIYIDLMEWPTLREAIDIMIEQCRKGDDDATVRSNT